MNLRVEEILSSSGEPMNSAILSESTKFIFRSGSARIFWLIQISQEMWDFTEDGDMYCERLFDKFIVEIMVFYIILTL